MQKKEIKKILVCVVAIAMLIFTIASSFAAEPQTQLRPGENVNINGNGVYQNIQTFGNNTTNNIVNNKTNNALNNTTNKTTNNTTNNAINNTNNTALPYTGAEYTGILSIAVCIVVAVYSYIKVKKYNV